MLLAFQLDQKSVDIVIMGSEPLLLILRFFAWIWRDICIAPRVTLKNFIGQAHYFGEAVTELMGPH